MTSFFRNKLEADIGTSEVNVLTTNVGTRSTVIGLSLTNKTDLAVLASIRLEQWDTETVPSVIGEAYYIKNVLVPPNQSLRVINGGEKLILSTSMKMYVVSSTANGLDLVMSYVDIV